MLGYRARMADRVRQAVFWEPAEPFPGNSRVHEKRFYGEFVRIDHGVRTPITQVIGWQVR